VFRTISQTTIHYRGSRLSVGVAGTVSGGDRLPWVPLDGADDNSTPLASLDWQFHVYGDATGEIAEVCRLLKNHFKIQDRDDRREVREKVTGKLLTLDRAMEPTLPALLALLDVPGDDAAWQTLDPGSAAPPHSRCCQALAAARSARAATSCNLRRSPLMLPADAPSSRSAMKSRTMLAFMCASSPTGITYR
jgi:hypothetical protein